MSVNDNIRIVGINFTYYLREDLEEEGIDTMSMSDEQVEDLWNEKYGDPWNEKYGDPSANPISDEEWNQMELVSSAIRSLASYGIDTNGWDEDAILAKDDELCEAKWAEYNEYEKSLESEV